MPSKIQQLPVGYLSALGIRGTGSNPVDASDAVIPMIDMGPYYAALNLEGVDATGTGLQTVADGVDLPIPQGEVWALLALSAEAFSITSGNVVSFFVGVRVAGTGQHTRVFNFRVQQTLSANERLSIGGFIGQPLILPGGSNLRAQLNITTANTLSLRVQAVVQRLRS